LRAVAGNRAVIDCPCRKAGPAAAGFTPEKYTHSPVTLMRACSRGLYAAFKFNKNLLAVLERRHKACGYKGRISRPPGRS
jgi:hypothetical protein